MESTAHHRPVRGRFRATRTARSRRSVRRLGEGRVSIHVLADAVVLLGLSADPDGRLAASTAVPRGQVKKVPYLKRAASDLGSAMHTQGIRRVAVELLAPIPEKGVSAVLDGLKRNGLSVDRLIRSDDGHVPARLASKGLGMHAETRPDAVDPDVTTATLPSSLATTRGPQPTGSTPPPLESELGPFYSLPSLVAKWDVTRQAINARVHRHTLLGLPTTNNRTIFPAFQFTQEDGTLHVLPGLSDVLRALAAGGAGPTLMAVWLVTPQEELGDRAAVDVLREDGNARRVLPLAERDAARWSQ